MPAANTAETWTLVEKVFMRELTRPRGPITQANMLVATATDAANAATAARARALLEGGYNCGLANKLIDQTTQMILWRNLAGFASSFAKLAQAQREEVLALLQNSTPNSMFSASCMTLASKYGTLASASNYDQAAIQDPVYESDSTLRSASWDPYNPNAGSQWMPSAPPGGTPPGGVPGTTPPTPGVVEPTDPLYKACKAAIDVPEVEKGLACAFLTSSATSVEQLKLAVVAYDYRGLPRAAAMARAALAARGVIVPPGPASGGPPPTPGTPGVVNWNCTPFPQCLADSANWPQNIPQPCTPFPACICTDDQGRPVAFPGCPTISPPALPPPGTQPGTQPVSVPPTTAPPAETAPWYKTPLGIAALGIGGLLGLAAVVVVARAA